jgi:DNA-binding transcriptional regulator GbsR (MarR family)
VRTAPKLGGDLTAIMFEMGNHAPANERLLRAQDQFIHEWGRMGSSWGINRTMAQIHALLFISSDPLDVDQIIVRLLISRGNASMSLRDLMDWGIVRRFRRPGERRDVYTSEIDPWQMFSRVIRERKRREIDPTARALRECLAMLPGTTESTDETTFSDRLSGLLEVFDLLDAIYQQIFSTDSFFLETVNLFKEQSADSTAILSRGTAKKT